jgi:enoyl-CoA hydratase
MSTTPLGPGIRVERQGRIATVVFDAADKANALSIDVLRGLLEAARSLETEHDLSAVVLSGARERFTMGFDLRDAARSAGLSLAERRELQALGPRLCAAWEGIEALTIAAVEGWCVGGGVALAVALDVRVAGGGCAVLCPRDRTWHEHELGVLAPHRQPGRPGAGQATGAPGRAAGSG